VFHDLPADRLYTIVEPDAPPPARHSPPAPPTWFAASDALRAAEHRERPFNDFEKQPLLSHSFTQLGPAMAWADIDHDSDDDLFLGGAAGQPGSLWINEGKAVFALRESSALTADRECEDMGAVWFDADADGDLDLYVVSGGVEHGSRAHLLRDRLYINDGQGELTKAPSGTLPELEDSGGPAAPADFDRDGDVDLFVGGRLLPGQYPHSPPSRLLRYDGGRFTDITASAAPELRQSGMVTSALWSDVDADGWLDLLLAHEWGPVKLYRNRTGRLVDETAAAGLSELVGWWNGITGRDIDNDGDIDYVATNLGLNTRYRASLDNPALLFYGDFDDLGEKQPVEAHVENGKLYPLHHRILLSEAFPSLKDRFTSHQQFGMATLEEIFSPDAIRDAQKFSMNTLESGVLLNDGAGRFAFRPLPRIAQASAAFGAALSDFDADGNVDLYLAQNFFSLPLTHGRVDGGLSMLLQGDGRGNFSAVMPKRSGLVLPGDAKSVAVTDVNADGWPDLVVGMNNAGVKAFANAAAREQKGRPFHVLLEGKPGNPTGVGARVSLRLDGQSAQTAELYAGDGYLSQSGAKLFFSIPANRSVRTVDVRWPDGKTSSTSVEADNLSIVIRQQE
jgi:enediyne biosynthesis protein E4